MDTKEEECIDKVGQFEWIWCNDMNTQEEQCIQKVGQFEWIWLNEMVTQVDNCVQEAAKGPVIIPGVTRIFAMPC